MLRWAPLAAIASLLTVGPANGQTAEYVSVLGVEEDQAVIERANGTVYLVETGVGCISIWRYEGARVVVSSPGLFLGVGSRLLIPELEQECRIWNSEVVSSSPRSSHEGLPMPSSVAESPFDFYDSQGEAVAYLATSDGMTLYLWSGEPVAYVDGDSLYGFNGTHLGWYHKGILYHNDGDVLAAPARAFVNPVSLPPLKGLKQLRPLKRLRELRPLRPLFGISWARMPAGAYLRTGR